MTDELKQCPRCGTIDVVLINGCCEKCNNEMMREAIESENAEQLRHELWAETYGES